MRSIWFGLAVFGVTLLTTACAPDDRSALENFGYGRNSYERRVERGSGQWTPSRLSLKCAGAHCRPQVGMLIEVESQDSAGWTIGRCTATLIGADLIVSAAHCVDRSSTKPKYFLTLDGRATPVTNVEFWRLTPEVDGKKNDVAPDVVVLRLQSSTDLTPLAIARGDRPQYQSLTALVVNANSSTEFRIDAITCPIHRTAEFPFAITENPEMILSVGCGIVQGNSGGPVFAPGRDELEAVVTANVPTDGRGLGWFTNLRCQPILGRETATCVPLTKKTRTERYTSQLEHAAGAIPSFSQTERSQWQTEDELFQYALGGLVEGAPALEVISEPKCLREGVELLSDVRFIDQLVKFDNRTGVFKATLVKSRTIVGRVVSNYKGWAYQVEVDWPAPYAALREPQTHPSVRRGRSFKLELPRCAR